MKIIISIIRYILLSIILYLGKLSTWILAPIFALFIRHREESEITKRTSLMPGTPREFLIPGLMWAQTHDAPVDEYKVLADRYAMTKKDGVKVPKWTYKLIHLPFIGNYLARVFWLVRNPAYGLAERLGFTQDGLTITYDSKISDGVELWRSGITGYDTQYGYNSKGQFGFLIQGQWVYSQKRLLEFRLGYGLTRKSPLRGKGMIYARVLPWKKR